MRSAGTIFIVIGIGAAYLLICAWFVIGIPWLHFLWNICSFFLVFYVISTLTNYSAAVIFAIIMSVGIPLWDSLVPAETNVELTLWIILAVAIGASVTVAIELAFARTRPGDDIVLPIARRLANVRSVLLSYAEGRAPDNATKRNILRHAGGGDHPGYGASCSGLPIPLVPSANEWRRGPYGRLVDIAATLRIIPWQPSVAIATRARNLAAAIGSTSDDLLHQRIPEPVQLESEGGASPEASLLGEMEDAVTLIPKHSPART